MKIKLIESEMEHEKYASVIDVSAASAIRFFGFDPKKARAVDMGPSTRNPERWKPEARVWRVYKSAADMPS